MRRREPLAERFWPKVQRTTDEYSCWEWQAGTHPFGYGYINEGGRGSALLAHRVSWVLHFGEIPEGMSVLHRCDNPPCVRPEHLFLGDHDANMADMASKGRWTPRNSIAPEKRARGERVGTAKLTVELVRQIRERYAAGGVTMAGLAEEYGVRDSTIYTVISRKRWAHVD